MKESVSRGTPDEHVHVHVHAHAYEDMRRGEGERQTRDSRELAVALRFAPDVCALKNSVTPVDLRGVRGRQRALDASRKDHSCGRGAGCTGGCTGEAQSGGWSICSAWSEEWAMSHNTRRRMLSCIPVACMLSRILCCRECCRECRARCARCARVARAY